MESSASQRLLSKARRQENKCLEKSALGNSKYTENFIRELRSPETQVSEGELCVRLRFFQGYTCEVGMVIINEIMPSPHFSLREVSGVMFQSGTAKLSERLQVFT